MSYYLVEKQTVRSLRDAACTHDLNEGGGLWVHRPIPPELEHDSGERCWCAPLPVYWEEIFGPAPLLEKKLQQFYRLN